jgi:predicted nucleotidyltransferase
MSSGETNIDGIDIQYRSLLQSIIDEAVHQEDRLGILLKGSVARGDALPGSDLDISFMLIDGNSREFQPEIRQGIMVEQSYTDMARALSQIETNPMQVYAYLDGRILYDPAGAIKQLTNQARLRFATYQTSEHERHEIAYWLQSVQLKLRVALNANDVLKAAYLSSTVSWQFLRGLWAVNNKPMPPNGSVWPHLKDLSQGPDAIEEQLYYLFCGETLQRIHTTLGLLEWILTHMH